MKKNFFEQLLGVLLLVATALMINSCKGCKQSEEQKVKSEEAATAAVYHDYDGVVQDFTAGVSQIQALHRQTVYHLAGGVNYEWRNSRVILNDTITTENIDGLHVTDVNDVFCYWNERGPWVQYVNSNVKNGLQIPWPINDVWIEDSDLSNLQIELSAEDALLRLKEWNGVVPPANFITLRCPVGPEECNAQWVIGNVYNTIFIDAVTGDITDSNPAFPRK